MQLNGMDIFKCNVDYSDSARVHFVQLELKEMSGNRKAALGEEDYLPQFLSSTSRQTVSKMWMDVVYFSSGIVFNWVTDAHLSQIQGQGNSSYFD